MNDARLASPARAGGPAAGIAHEHHAVLDSTNETALARLVTLADDERGVWITADAQRSGRGRRGRAWTSLPGNLFATFASLVPTDASRATLPLVAAVALADAVETACPEAWGRVGLKWPNDLLLDGRKVAGILLEAQPFEGRTAVAVGFGVNCAAAPAIAGYAATSFADAGLALERGTLLTALAAALEREWDALVRPDHANGVIERWRARAHGLGERVTVRLPDRELAGTFEDMAPDGRLVLARDDGTRELVAAGDVFPERMQGTEHDSSRRPQGAALP